MGCSSFACAVESLSMPFPLAMLEDLGKWVDKEVFRGESPIILIYRDVYNRRIVHEKTVIL